MVAAGQSEIYSFAELQLAGQSMSFFHTYWLLDVDGELTPGLYM